MGKKRERQDSYSAVLDSTLQMHLTGREEESPPNKKPKKHKKRKSSKKDKNEEKQNLVPHQVELVETLVMEDDDDQEIHVEDIEADCDSLADPGMKLMMKTPDVNSEKIMKIHQKNKSDKSKSGSSSKVKKKKDGSKAEDDTDSEEERWLDAIESGKLEEVDDELKRIKNPRLMTARQRALMEKRSDGVDETFPAIPAEPLLALPSGFKEKVLTEEMLAKKAIKSKRRREQAIEKREEDKKKTVDRLLKKQDSKTSKGARSKILKKAVPLMSYFNNKEGIFLSLPVGMELPFMPPLPERYAPKPVICGAKGCFNLKKYSCSKTGIPLCSLGCYKKNMEVNAVSLASL